MERPESVFRGKNDGPESYRKNWRTEILELLRKVCVEERPYLKIRLRLGRRGTELLPTLLETHTPDAVVLMLGTNDCKTIFGASAEIIGKGIARLLEQINQYADKMKVLVISPIYLGEKVWQDGYDQEFSPESVEVSKKLEPVYEKVAGKYGKRFMRAADYANPSEADQEHMDGQSHKILADAIYRKLEAEIL